METTRDLGFGLSGREALGKHARNGLELAESGVRAEALELGREPARIRVVVQCRSLPGGETLDVTRGGGAACNT